MFNRISSNKITAKLYSKKGSGSDGSQFISETTKADIIICVTVKCILWWRTNGLILFSYKAGFVKINILF